jgi:DNA replication and repair protein RecF
MYLKHLLLKNFRNYTDAEVAFSESINVIQGENGQGKTNLLEAIYLISTGRSFRAHALSNLISFGKQFFYLEAEFHKDAVTQCIKVYYDDNTRKVQYNAVAHTTFTSLLGILPSVLHSPEDVSLISGSPAERRRFLDIHIAQTDPLYLHHLGHYFKAMKQRNHLLRSKSDEAIGSWEQMMAESASYLVLKRSQAVDTLKSSASKWVNILSRNLDTIQLTYHCSPSILPTERDLVSHFQRAWQKNRPREMLFGSTQIGPHRDDLLIHLTDRSAKTFSSEGQKRSCVSALRFAQWEHMEHALGYPPMLGIDDFGIQLDQERQLQLQSHLPQFHQVFLTSPNAIKNINCQGAPPHILTINKGVVQQNQSISN